jgi:hypothetical protein
MAAVVISVAIELDGQTLRGPAAVDPPAVDAGVGLGKRKPSVANAGNERVLELAEGHGDFTPENATKLSGARPVMTAGQYSPDLCWGRAVPDAGLMADACQLVLAQYGGEVDESSRDCCHRDPPPGALVPEVRSASAMSHHSRDAALGRSEYLGQWRSALEKPEEMRPGTTGQQGSIPTGLHRSHVMSREAGRSVPDPENPTMNADQSAASEPRLDLGARHPRPGKLLPRHDAVRQRGEAGEDLFDCPAFC